MASRREGGPRGGGLATGAAPRVEERVTRRVMMNQYQIENGRQSEEEE